MLIYIDHGFARGFYTSISKIRELLAKNPGLLTSTIIFEIDNPDDFKNLIIEYWGKITYNLRFIESTVSIVEQYRRNIIDINRLKIELVKLLSKHSYYLEDLYALNIFMKSLIGFNLLDLDLIIIHENPQDVMKGLRLKPLNIHGKLICKDLILVKKLRDKIYTLSFETCITKQLHTSKIEVIDYFSNGLYSYTTSQHSIINDVEVGDPVLIAYLKYGVKIRSRISSRNLIIFSGCKCPCDIPLTRKLCEKILDNDIKLLHIPSTMRSKEIEFLKIYFEQKGCKVFMYDKPVDLILDCCISNVNL